MRHETIGHQNRKPVRGADRGPMVPGADHRSGHKRVVCGEPADGTVGNRDTEQTASGIPEDRASENDIMASIAIDKKTGLRRLLFFVNGKRVSVNMGPAFRVNFSKGWLAREKTENAIYRGHVRAMILAREQNDPLPKVAAAWVKGLHPSLRSKLEKVGLLEPENKPEPKPEKPVIPMDEFIKGYIEKRAGIKPTTVLSWDVSRKRIIKHFGKDRPIDSVTEQDAVDFRDAMLRWGLTENTARKTIAIARQFFETAIRHCRLLCKKIAIDIFS
jgi:hypothetical protein